MWMQLEMPNARKTIAHTSEKETNKWRWIRITETNTGKFKR